MMAWGAALAALALGLAWPRAAAADADEASLHLTALGGVARVGDDAAIAATGGETRAAAVLAGAGVRATYATRDWLAYEVSAAYLRSSTARFPGHTDVMTEDGGLEAGEVLRDLRVLRATAGVSLRLGVRLIPTVTIAAGVQHRAHVAGAVVADTGTAGFLADAGYVDLVAAAGAGLDYRINRRWVAGASVAAVHAFSLGGPASDAVEGAVHLSYYFYPRVFGFD